MSYDICVGTIGGGLWIGYDAGNKWRQIQGPMDFEGAVRSLAQNPEDCQHLLASVDGAGIYDSKNGGNNWKLLSELRDRPIWSLTFDPHDSSRIYAGTRPGLFASDDAGESFKELVTTMSDRCIIGIPRTTNVVVDPTRSEVVWASVEIDGLHKSCDRGITWESLGELGPGEFYNDVHGLTIHEVNGRSEILITSPFGLGRSIDDGESWIWHEFASFEGSKLAQAYSRCVRVPWDDGTVIVCVGGGIPGGAGGIEVSYDFGETFERSSLPDVPNSTMYWLATHKDLPGVVAATSVYGDIYVTEDICRSWQKLERELGEIRSAILVPSD